MKYLDFISTYKVYSTVAEAKEKGYEAHHIIPVCLQGKRRNSPDLDNRCVRLTPFEHVYAHYLLALENEKCISTFSQMVNTYYPRFSDLEKITIEELEYFGELRKKGIQKISESKKGKGHKQTEKAKRILSEKLKGNQNSKGRKCSLETIQKMSQTKMGHTVSDETKLKISKTKMGCKPPYSKKVYQLSLTDDVLAIFESACEAKRQTGIQNIVNCCNGKRKTAGGYHWKYA